MGQAIVGIEFGLLLLLLLLLLSLLLWLWFWYFSWLCLKNQVQNLLYQQLVALGRPKCRGCCGCGAPKMEDASGWRRPFQTRFGWAVLENHTVPHMNEKIHFKILGYFFYSCTQNPPVGEGICEFLVASSERWGRDNCHHGTWGS